MALLDDLFLTASSLYENLFVRIIGAVLFVLLLGYLFSLLRKVKEKHDEVEAVEEGGGTFTTTYNQLEAERRQERLDQAEEQAERNRAKKEDKSLAGGEQAAQNEGAVEEQVTRAEETTTATLAELEITAKTVRADIANSMRVARVEEKEFASVEALEKELVGLQTFSQIDAKTAEYLLTYFKSFLDHCSSQIFYEEQFEEYQRNFVKQFQAQLERTKSFENVAKDFSQSIKRKEKRERRSFKREIKNLHKEIKNKYKELKKEEGNDTNPSLLANLNNEMKILSKNAALLQRVEDETKKSQTLLEEEIDRLKKEVSKLIDISKAEAKKKSDLGKRESEVEKRVESLKEKKKVMERDVENLEKNRQQLRGLILALCGYLKDYFNAYAKRKEEDILFERLLRDFLLQNLLASRSLEVMSRLFLSIEQAEEALEQGLAATVQLLGSLTTKDLSYDVSLALKSISKAQAVLTQEVKITQTLIALAQEVEREYERAISDLDIFIRSEEKERNELVALGQEEAHYFGRMVAIVMNKKVALDQSYEREIESLEAALQKRNEVAAAALAQARV